jgi:hypothetical protein
VSILILNSNRHVKKKLYKHVISMISKNYLKNLVDTNDKNYKLNFYATKWLNLNNRGFRQRLFRWHSFRIIQVSCYSTLNSYFSCCFKIMVSGFPHDFFNFYIVVNQENYVLQFRYINDIITELNCNY